ncbi:MAG TPA: efflux RND transporter periplasmic adaptor subunit [Woeseiaceae bacterium]|nr:efflux RND transporter periplasmic adaptor subunit [Woeseiaceae bacterium]
MTQYSRNPFLLPLFLLLVTGGCEEEQAPPPQQGAPAVTVVTLKTEPVELTRQLPGRTTAYLIAEVRPQVTGIVEERLFEEGSVVEAGQPLYQLDDATYRARYNSARASLARAEATVEVARLNAARAEELVKANAVSRQEYENAVAALQQAEADVGVAEADVASSRVELDYARITSPIAGRIGKSSVTQGALVTADQATPLATVQQLDPIYVDLTQSASELLQLRQAVAGGTVRGTEDTPVTILLEDGTPFQHEGVLGFSDVSVDPSTGSFSLRVTVPNPEHLLMPGMYVRAVLSTAVLEDGILVPQQGIARDAKGNANALVVGNDGTVEQRTVEVARTIGAKWLVRSGLMAGDRVIVEGVQKVQPGMPVEATEAPSAAADAEPAVSPETTAADRQ